MAIYIKGLDMPTNCTDCRYKLFAGCNPYQDNGLSPSDHRHRTCPLIEAAEPHGRLIATMSDLISRQDAINVADAVWSVTGDKNVAKVWDQIKDLPSAQPEITDEQAILHLQTSGWMQTHDKEMFEMGLREKLADDSDSYDALLPSAQPEQRWIPCSERLPAKRRSVLITTSEGFVGEACYWETTENHVIWKGYRWNATYWDDEVLAWMPLPTPYKGGDTE